MMRADQLDRLRALSEKLAEVVLEEADPAEWPGAGQPLASVDAQTRGDRYWCKKNAAATFMLLDRTMALVDKVKAPADGSQPPEPELEKEISRAEKAAAAALDRVMGATRKAAFDRRTHGGKA